MTQSPMANPKDEPRSLRARLAPRFFCCVRSPCPSRAIFLFIEEMAHFIEEMAHFIEKHNNGPKLVILLSRLDRERDRRLWGFVAVPMASRSGLSGLFAPWGWQGIQPPAPHPLKTIPRPPAAAPLSVPAQSPANKPCFSSIKIVSSALTAIGYHSPYTCASPSPK